MSTFLDDFEKHHKKSIQSLAKKDADLRNKKKASRHKFNASDLPDKPKKPRAINATRIHGREYMVDGGLVTMSLNMSGILGTRDINYRLQKAIRAIRPELTEYAKDKFSKFVPYKSGKLRTSATVEDGVIYYEAVNSKGDFNYAPWVYTGDWMNFSTPGTTAYWDKVAWQDGSTRGLIIRKANYLIKKELGN